MFKDLFQKLTAVSKREDAPAPVLVEFPVSEDPTPDKTILDPKDREIELLKRMVADLREHNAKLAKANIDSFNTGNAAFAESREIKNNIKKALYEFRAWLKTDY